MLMGYETIVDESERVEIVQDLKSLHAEPTNGRSGRMHRVYRRQSTWSALHTYWLHVSHVKWRMLPVTKARVDKVHVNVGVGTRRSQTSPSQSPVSVPSPFVAHCVLTLQPHITRSCQR